MLGLSPLRWMGLVAGIALAVVAFVRLRRYGVGRGPVTLYGLAGVALAAVSLVPQIVNLPADVFALRDHPAGRLITLLILATSILFALLLWNRAKLERQLERHERLVRSLVQTELPEEHCPSRQAPTWIVVPAYNEADNIGPLLERIQQALTADAQILVVDDGSTDSTVAVAKQYGAAIARLPVNAGGGASLRTGFDIAIAHGATYVVTMDADGQHDPGHLPALLEPLRSGAADVVIGSRTLGSEVPASAARALGVRLFNVLISRLLGICVTDCASGYRAITADALQRLHLAQPQYHTAELIIEAAKHGFRIEDVPISIGPRWSGESKKGTDWSYGVMFLRTVLKTWLR